MTEILKTGATTESEWIEASPFSPHWQKMMMWLFIVGDALLFAGFLTCYAFGRVASETWPDASAVFGLKLVTFMTVVLISSGALMASAVHAARAGQWDKVWRRLLYTIVGGTIFLGSQAFEWAHLIHEGARLNFNPWGVPAFGASFFVITGFHGFHVLSGLVILTIMMFRTSKRLCRAEGLELAGMYWAFVDLVWVFVFPLFYLI
jgi:cytochrome c oxidase subunit III